MDLLVLVIHPNWAKILNSCLQISSPEENRSVNRLALCMDSPRFSFFSRNQSRFCSIFFSVKFYIKSSNFSIFDKTFSMDPYIFLIHVYSSQENVSDNLSDIFTLNVGH